MWLIIRKRPAGNLYRDTGVICAVGRKVTMVIRLCSRRRWGFGLVLAGMGAMSVIESAHGNKCLGIHVELRSAWRF